MNGAEVLLRTLAASGVDVCFANPGTSELHSVAALDRVPELRGVLTLFEGVATGAADGYARVASRPASTLLHLGPGLANGIANLHNAKRAQTPLVNVVGDHATYHKRFSAPLESDLPGLAGVVSGWFRSSARADDVAGDAVDAVRAAYGPPGQVATLALPADVSWSEAAGGPAAAAPPGPPSRVPSDTVEQAAKALRSGEPAALLLGGSALRPRGLTAAERVGRATGAKLVAETFPANMARGGGLPPVERLAYLGEMALTQLGDIRHLVIAGAKSPVSFFAYPDKPSDLVPEGCTVHRLATTADDVPAALEDLAAAVDARGGTPPVDCGSAPERPNGAITPETFAAAVGCLLPEGAVVVDETVTSGVFLPSATAAAPRHDWLTLTGGAIGQGMPVATGAAVAAPDRPVLCLEADGSAMYTIQSLWTQAREGLDVTTVILANHAYGILQFELSRVGAEGGGGRAGAMLDLSRPDLDFVSLARGMGVPATTATDAAELADKLEGALASPGPSLIEAVLPGR
ncbi:MAG: acetolactate synthase large subunit [Acidimicrobiales bacterium]